MSEEPEEEFEEMDPDVITEMEPNTVTPQEAADRAIPGGLYTVDAHSGLCALCGKPWPHEHTPQQIDEWEAQGGVVVGPMRAEKPTYATLSKPWNAAEPGTTVTTDRAEAEKNGWLPVDPVRFEALEKGGFFGEVDEKDGASSKLVHPQATQEKVANPVAGLDRQPEGFFVQDEEDGA